MPTLAERLKETGLTVAESLTYLALLEEGPSGCGALCKKTGTYRVQGYRTLDALVKKGLTSYFVKNGRRVFEAENPRRIAEDLKEKQKEAERLADELSRLTPLKKAETGMKLFEGWTGIRAAQENYLQSMKARQGEYLMVGASVGLHEKLDRFFNQFHEKRSRLRVPARLLFNEDNRHFGEVKKKYRPVQVRYLPNEAFTPSWTSLYEDTMLIGLQADAPLAIVIRNPQIVESFRNYFELLWKAGKR